MHLSLRKRAITIIHYIINESNRFVAQISLLVLAGFGQLTSTLTTEEVYIPNPNVKRELPEGNFGDRTPIFHKFGESYLK